MPTLDYPEEVLSGAERAESAPDMFDQTALEGTQPDEPLEEVPYPTLKTAIKACVPLIALAVVGSMVVAGAVLGGKLMLIGFAVAFMLIMFIGMPLMLASITDALDTH